MDDFLKFLEEKVDKSIFPSYKFKPSFLIRRQGVGYETEEIKSIKKNVLNLFKKRKIEQTRKKLENDENNDDDFLKKGNKKNKL